MAAHIPAGRSMWLLARLRLRRLANMTGKAMRQAASGGKSRAATKSKSRMGWALGLFVGAMMLFTMLNMANQGMSNFHCQLDHETGCYKAERRSQVSENASVHLQAAPFSDAMQRAVTMQMLLLLAVGALFPLGARESSSVDWDLEWLVTLPIPTAQLMWARLFERTLVNPAGWVFLLPFCAMVAWDSGYRWTVPLLGIAATFTLLCYGALVRTLVDTGLRMKVAPSALRNIFALVSVVAAVLVYFVLSFAMAGKNSMIIGLARSFPAWANWTPPGLAVQALNAPVWWQGAGLFALLLAETAFVMAAGVYLLQYLLRHGVAGTGARESTRSAAPARAPEGKPFWRFGSPIQRRELRLLGRDRNFLVQTLILPVVIVGSQIYFNSAGEASASTGFKPSMVAIVAFGISAYMLMLSAFQTLHTEKGALWMLYTFPQSIENVLKEKAKLWGALALVYPVLVFGGSIYLAGAVTPGLAEMALMVMLGLPVYAVIAVALGVFACNPLAQDNEPPIKPTYSYLYMLLVSLYIYAILVGAWSQKLVTLVLTGALALALWQKARDELPFLLDPTASPPQRVSLADGMIAALLFFVLQGLFTMLFLATGSSPFKVVVISFAIAGALTFAMVRYSFWRLKFAGVPAIFGGAGLRAVGIGLAGGALAALIGLAYTYVASRLGLGGSPEQLFSMRPAALWLFALAVLAAPLFEEFIFRGLIFGGLRRSLGLTASMLASAAIFAIVHPPASMLPVFALGVCAAVVYEKTKSLAAPILTHALYNAVVVAAYFSQW